MKTTPRKTVPRLACLLAAATQWCLFQVLFLVLSSLAPRQAREPRVLVPDTLRPWGADAVWLP